MCLEHKTCCLFFSLLCLPSLFIRTVFCFPNDITLRQPCDSKSMLFLSLSLDTTFSLFIVTGLCIDILFALSSFTGEEEEDETLDFDFSLSDQFNL